MGFSVLVVCMLVVEIVMILLWGFNRLGDFRVSCVYCDAGFDILGFSRSC
jgi:hypothetical protein